MQNICNCHSKCDIIPAGKHLILGGLYHGIYEKYHGASYRRYVG